MQPRSPQLLFFTFTIPSFLCSGQNSGFLLPSMPYDAPFAQAGWRHLRGIVKMIDPGLIDGSAAAIGSQDPKTYK